MKKYERRRPCGKGDVLVGKRKFKIEMR